MVVSSNTLFILSEGNCGGSRIRTYEDISQQIYSLPQLAALVSPRIKEQLSLFEKGMQNYMDFYFNQTFVDLQRKNPKDRKKSTDNDHCSAG